MLTAPSCLRGVLSGLEADAVKATLELRTSIRESVGMFNFGAILYLSFWMQLLVEANILCNRIPGLSPRQRTICYNRPDALAAVGDGDLLALKECRFQFRYHRWNCTNIGGTETSLGLPHVVKSREMAVFFAIRSAAITFTVTQSCSHGNLSGCSCDKTKPEGSLTTEGWRWGGCSADIEHGLRFSRQFVDARETDQDARSLMNLHNNRAGRKAIADLTGRACRCSGVSGSCTMKICWTTLPNFRSVGERLLDKYEHRTKQVQPIRGHRDLRPLFLTLKRSKKLNRKPRTTDLVFLDKSPNYCEFDASTGSLGTFERQCNRTSKGRDGCDYMCCGRGYTTRQFNRVWQCNCKFQWCCRVVCSQCSEKTVVLACR